jgi:hypothetical protein
MLNTLGRGRNEHVDHVVKKEKMIKTLSRNYMLQMFQMLTHSSSWDEHLDAVVSGGVGSSSHTMPSEIAPMVLEQLQLRLGGLLIAARRGGPPLPTVADAVADHRRGASLSLAVQMM